MGRMGKKAAGRFLAKQREAKEQEAADKAAAKKSKKRWDEEEPAEKPKAPEKKAWTGKYPIALLYETLQRNDYSKPVVKPMKADPDMYKFRVIVPPSKKANKEQLVFNPDRSHKTTQDAKNYAGLYTLSSLFRDMPLERILPPEWREDWRRLIVKREEQVVKAQQRAEIEQKKKEKAERIQAWEESLPKIFMGPKSRALVQAALALNSDVLLQQSYSTPSSDLQDSKQVRDARKKLLRMGFVEEDVMSGIQAVLSSIDDDDVVDTGRN